MLPKFSIKRSHVTSTGGRFWKINGGSKKLSLTNNFQGSIM